MSPPLCLNSTVFFHRISNKLIISTAMHQQCPNQLRGNFMRVRAPRRLIHKSTAKNWLRRGNLTLFFGNLRWFLQVERDDETSGESRGVGCAPHVGAEYYDVFWSSSHLDWLSVQSESESSSHLRRYCAEIQKWIVGTMWNIALIWSEFNNSEKGTLCRLLNCPSSTNPLLVGCLNRIALYIQKHWKTVVK